MQKNGLKDNVCDDVFLKRLSLLFILFSILCILAGASRLCSASWNLSQYADVLRVRELLSMFVFAPVIAVFFWLFHRCVGRGRVNRGMDVICILSIYAVACGMGIHDPMNCIGSAYKSELASVGNLRDSIVYMDDQLGHWVFWGGFVLGTWCIGINQIMAPLKNAMSLKWKMIFTVVSVALLGVMLTNLWDEYPKTKADLMVIGGAVAGLLPFHMFFAAKVSLMRLPVIFVFYSAYIGSIAGTLICWQFRYGIFF